MSFWTELSSTLGRAANAAIDGEIENRYSGDQRSQPEQFAPVNTGVDYDGVAMVPFWKSSKAATALLAGGGVLVVGLVILVIKKL